MLVQLIQSIDKLKMVQIHWESHRTNALCLLWFECEFKSLIFSRWRDWRNSRETQISWHWLILSCSCWFKCHGKRRTTSLFTEEIQIYIFIIPNNVMTKRQVDYDYVFMFEALRCVLRLWYFRKSFSRPARSWVVRLTSCVRLQKVRTY